MKTKKTAPNQLMNIYFHPSAVLFRAIELKIIHNNTKKINFLHPSLDLGCGDGKIATLLFDEYFTYGVDNGEAKDVGEAIQKGIYGKVFLESAESMSLINESVNFVFSNCVIEHIPDNEAVLSEVSRILKKDGQFIFTVPSNNFPDYLYLSNKLAAARFSFLSKLYKYRRNKMLNHFHCYSISDWNKKLEKYRLKVVNYQYYINREALMLWDKIAIEVFIKKIWNKKIYINIFKKYQAEINKAYALSDIDDDKGACLFIHCKKI